MLDRLFFQKHSVRPDMLNNNLPGITFGMFGQAWLHFQETFLRPRLIFRKPQVSLFFYVDKASETSIQIHFMILFVRSEYAFTAKFILKKQKRIKYRNELWRLSVPKYVQPSPPGGVIFVKLFVSSILNMVNIFISFVECLCEKARSFVSENSC